MTSTTTDRRKATVGSAAVKSPCIAGTTSNITLSGEQTIDGVAVVANDRVLVKSQTDGTENGIYLASTGSWTREPDWDGPKDVVQGTLVYVSQGTNLGFYKVTTTGTITPGTTDTTITDVTLIESTQIINDYFLYGSASAAGTDTYASSLPVAPSAYQAGQRYQFLADVANTGPCTVNFNSLGAKSIKMLDGNDPYNGAIQVAPVDVMYDGTNFVLLNPHGYVQYKSGRRNHVTNGAMQIAQRGTSFTSATSFTNNDDSYTLDGWLLLSDGNDVVDVTQETSVVPTNGLYALAADIETINKKFGFLHIIEQKDCIGLIGETVTLSFQAAVSATTKLDNIKAAIISWDGTADTVTSDIVSAWNIEGTDPTLVANWTYENTPANLNVTTSYAKYSVSAAIDTASTTNIGLFIWSDVTDTTLGDFFRITDVQLEKGAIATDFERKSIAGELNSCRRNVRQLVDTSAAISYILPGQVISTTQAIFVVDTSEMRTTPSVTFSAATTFDVLNVSGAAIQCTVITADSILEKNFRIVATVASGLVAGSGTLLRSDATPATILLSSEL